MPFKTYIIRIGNEPYVKIGRAVDPSKRCRTFQCSHFHRLRLLLVIDFDCERSIKDRFSAFRVREKCDAGNEVFRYSREMREFVKHAHNVVRLLRRGIHPVFSDQLIARFRITRKDFELAIMLRQVPRPIFVSPSGVRIWNLNEIRRWEEEGHIQPCD